VSPPCALCLYGGSIVGIDYNQHLTTFPPQRHRVSRERTETN